MRNSPKVLATFATPSALIFRCHTALAAVIPMLRCSGPQTSIDAIGPFCDTRHPQKFASNGKESPVNRSTTVAASLIVAVLLSLHCEQADAGWGLPNLNPFAKKDSNQPVGPAKNDSWGLPSLPLPKLPGFGRDPSQPRGPARKSFLTKTKETLFPWTKTGPVPQKVTGTRRTYQPQSSFSSEPEESTPSIFSSWFQSDEDEKRRPVSPHEWLGNPRPQ